MKPKPISLAAWLSRRGISFESFCAERKIVTNEQLNSICGEMNAICDLTLPTKRSGFVRPEFVEVIDIQLTDSIGVDLVMTTSIDEQIDPQPATRREPTSDRPQRKRRSKKTSASEQIKAPPVIPPEHPEIN